MIHIIQELFEQTLRTGSPQNVYLLPQYPNFCLERCPRPKQINDHPNNEPDKISHPVTASPDSRSTASQIEFATGTAVRPNLAQAEEKLEDRGYASISEWREMVTVATRDGFARRKSGKFAN
jgi:hypothetical protein